MRPPSKPLAVSGKQGRRGFTPLTAYCLLLTLFALAGCTLAPIQQTHTPRRTEAPELKPAPAMRRFAIFTDQLPRTMHYVASGYMGDASDLVLSGGFIQTPNGEGPCIRINYRALGKQTWAGLYWQDPANNWGDQPGQTGYDLRGATRFTFWARGENGGEKIRQVRVGGLLGKYPDSDAAAAGPFTLTKDWKQYTIDLTGKDLRHIIGGFAIFLSKFENPGGSTFYLDDMVFEGPPDSFMNKTAPVVAVTSATSAVVTSTYTMGASTVTTPVVSTAPAVVPASAKDLTITPSPRGLRMSFVQPITFISGDATLTPASESLLKEVVAMLAAYPANNVLVEGHTDSTGDAQTNMRLSEMRAGSVRNFLIKTGRYAPSRFRIIGYGPTKPIADNATREGRAANRRVEITILKAQ